MNFWQVHLLPCAPSLSVCPFCVDPIEGARWTWACRLHSAHPICMGMLYWAQGCDAKAPASTRLSCSVCRAPWRGPADTSALLRLFRSTNVTREAVENRQISDATDAVAHARLTYRPVAPWAPIDVIPHCCPRVVQADGVFHILSSDARMEWAPTFNRESNSYTSQYLCMSCGESCSPMDDFLRWPSLPQPCRRGHRKAMLANMRNGIRYWVCVQGGPRSETPVVAISCTWVNADLEALRAAAAIRLAAVRRLETVDARRPPKRLRRLETVYVEDAIDVQSSSSESGPWSSGPSDDGMRANAR
jgi:hypothetical protein